MPKLRSNKGLAQQGLPHLTSRILQLGWKAGADTGAGRVFLGEEIVVERAPSATRGAVIDAGSHQRQHLIGVQPSTGCEKNVGVVESGLTHPLAGREVP